MENYSFFFHFFQIYEIFKYFIIICIKFINLGVFKCIIYDYVCISHKYIILQIYCLILSISSFSHSVCTLLKNNNNNNLVRLKFIINKNFIWIIITKCN